MTSSAGLFTRAQDEPLAARMRPRTVDEFVGQAHILGHGRLLRRAIEADQLSSLIFYGPPGTGKTTLARVIANTTKAHFTAINAVLAGVKDIREAVAEANERQRAGRRTILFVDEVHRFNKAQQDALLPWVESGTVVLVGATTENPYFEVNKALVSRSRIFQLKPLEPADLRRIAEMALADDRRGLGALPIAIDDDALDHLVDVSNGDARALLNALELAAVTTQRGDDGLVRITRSVAEESIQQRAVLYDKEGDAHFDTISAFIKSVRGSDPDAALYWLAKMVYAGEDPRFILRRLLILASEDVGLGDPAALGVVAAAAQAYDYVGLPEGRYHLAHATLYLATAPKSNSTMGFFDALEAVRREREAEVPNHLRDANRDAEGFGHGQGYAYPHAYRDHWVAQQYLPEPLQGKVFYQPSSQGYEREVRDEVARRREAQLAAMLEVDGDSALEVLTSGPVDRARDRWLERTVSNTGVRMARLRDTVIDHARLQRHHVVLDARAGSGLLTWEAVRRTPDGQVWAAAHEARDADALEAMAERLDVLARPVVLRAAPAALATALEAEAPVGLRFDAVLARGVPSQVGDLGDWLRSLTPWLGGDGRFVVSEADAGQAQRLSALVDLAEDPELAATVAAAEDSLYDRPDAWTLQHLAATVEAAGFTVLGRREVTVDGEQRIGRGALDRWFGDDTARGRYGAALRAVGGAQIASEIERRFRATLTDAVVPWRSAIAVVETRPA